MEVSKKASAASAISGYLLSFVLSIVLLLGTLVAVIRIGAFEQKSFEALVTKDYYTSVYNTFIDAARDYTIPTNIDPDVMNDTYTIEETERDVLGYVGEAFGKGKYEPDLTSSEQKLRENVLRFFESEDVETDGELEAIIDSYISDISGLYRSQMRMPGIDIILKARSRVVKYTPLALAGVGALALVLALFIILPNRSERTWPRYLAYAFGGAALMTAAAPAVIAITRVYERISLAPEYFYRFVMEFIRHLLKVCFIAAAILFGVMLLFILLAALIGRKNSGANAEKPAAVDVQTEE